jgi:hypothetical protein
MYGVLPKLEERVNFLEIEDYGSLLTETVGPNEIAAVSLLGSFSLSFSLPLLLLPFLTH